MGHHTCPLHNLSYDIGYDLSGLEGSLDIDTGYITDHEDVIERAIKPIAAHYDMDYRIVDVDEYQQNHPLLNKGLHQ